MAKGSKDTKAAATGSTVDAQIEQRSNDVSSCLGKVKKGRNLAMDAVEGCRTIVKLSSLGEDILVNDFSAHVAVGIDKTIESLKAATDLLVEASKLFAPYAK